MTHLLHRLQHKINPTRFERRLKLALYDLMQIHAVDFRLFVALICLSVLWFLGGVR